MKKSLSPKHKIRKQNIENTQEKKSSQYLEVKSAFSFLNTQTYLLLLKH